MPALDHKSISSILNLRASALISPAIAERQLEVIRRGFNHLYQEQNDVLYIADEVGLGKTYVALGIASLLRHFSQDPGSYQDMIIVPKANLQYKWEKEIRQFISKNYLLADNRVKSIIGTPVGEIIQKEKLKPIDNDHPAYHLYRNSQFSFAFSWKGEAKSTQLHTMLDRLTNKEAKSILEKVIASREFTPYNKSYLKRLYAYLLSTCHPPIELLIVDEGHNYKHGLGDVEDDDDDVSDRNNVVARFLGIERKTEDDKRIFSDFPQLKKLVHPKVKKLLILSATPKTSSLVELKKQMDCFKNVHLLSSFKRDDEIKDQLPYFLIRGNMEYSINGVSLTRNICRFEHRKGNVEKLALPPLLTLNDPEQAIIMGLLQYKTMKHLEAKNNPSFELGMLAGFETFKIDQEKRSFKTNGELVQADEQEYEETRTRKVRHSQDAEVLKEIIESYESNFNCLPPHPKQNAIVEATSQMMLKGEKSLIFVRRVASAEELERRLLDKWEAAVYDELKKKWSRRLQSNSLNHLLRSYDTYCENRALQDKLDNLLYTVSARLIERNYDFSFQHDEDVLRTGLDYIYQYHQDIDPTGEWYKQLRLHVNLKIIKGDWLEHTYRLLKDTFTQWQSWLQDDSGEDNEEQSKEESYFFHTYFSKAGNKAFKSRMYSNDWLDVNYFLLNQHFKLANYRTEELLETTINQQLFTGSSVKEVQEYFIKHIIEGEYHEASEHVELFHPNIYKSTLLTQVLLQACEEELAAFIEELQGRKKSEIFKELSSLCFLIKSTIRNGSGFLPLFIADKSEKDIVAAYLAIITDEQSIFNLVVQELKTIISDYPLIRAVNFPEGETTKQVERKLFFQSPVVGLTGQMKRNKSNIATQFRMPGFPYILVTTDIFREGEDLHTYCQNIYHYGIAWNCSDMEQRTGRIDRISSLSHRKMERMNAADFDEQVHVFYPYVMQTLEVNQVSKLFASINSFVETFNDFTEPVIEGSEALTSAAVYELPPVIKKPLHSKFEHTYFRGYDEGYSLSVNSTPGLQKDSMVSMMIQVQKDITSSLDFWVQPNFDQSSFELTGDIKINERNNRRGPFIIKAKNSVKPGEFKFEIASHIFKASTTNQRKIVEATSALKGYYLGDIGEFKSLAFEINYDDYCSDEFCKRLLNLVIEADRIEETISKDQMDHVIFG